MMKRLLPRIVPLGLCLLAAAPLQAELLAYEGFGEYAKGGLNGLDGT